MLAGWIGLSGVRRMHRNRTVSHCGALCRVRTLCGGPLPRVCMDDRRPSSGKSEDGRARPGVHGIVAPERRTDNLAARVEAPANRLDRRNCHTGDPARAVLTRV